MRLFQDFRLITHGSSVESIRAGKQLSAENETPQLPQLRILLSGKLSVRCDEVFLHYVSPFEFVDSVEWSMRNLGAPSKVHQVRTS